MTAPILPLILSELHAAAVTTPGTPLSLEGMFNLRDLGGYSTTNGRRTQTGRIFRADSLAHLTAADMAQLDALQLRLVCDLRSDRETEQMPDQLPAGVRREHHPMQINVNVMGDYRSAGFDWDEFRLESLYTHMLDHSGETFRHIFAHLAEPASYPYLFHCAGGKDRTGMVAALLLRTAGVPDETVVVDFALSDGYIAPKIPEFRRRMAERGIDSSGAEKLFRAPAEAMFSALEHLDAHYGSAAGYLTAIGVSDDQIEAFLRRFVA